MINNLQSVKIFLFHTDLDSTEGSFKNTFDHLISIFGTRLGGSGPAQAGPVSDFGDPSRRVPNIP